MPYTPAGIVSYGFPMDAFTFTYALSGVAATDAAVGAVAGYAVALDTTAPSTVKLAGPSDKIFGRIYVAENRSVLGIRTASVARKFKEKLPASVGHGIAVGDTVDGHATIAGYVKKATANDAQINQVVEVGADFVVVEKF